METGSAGQFLGTDQDGSFTWRTPTNTTYSVYTGQTGTGGYLVPDRDTSTETRYLREDGTWMVPPDTNTDTNTTYDFYASGSSNPTLVLDPSAGDNDSVQIVGRTTTSY